MKFRNNHKYKPQPTTLVKKGRKMYIEAVTKPTVNKYNYGDVNPETMAFNNAGVLANVITDAMNNGTRYAIKTGDTIQAKEVSRQEWLSDTDRTHFYLLFIGGSVFMRRIQSISGGYLKARALDVNYTDFTIELHRIDRIFQVTHKSA